MSRRFTALNVFIASPGGLKDERKAFREVIDSVNFDHAHDAGITFVPRGWEYASAGIGRPQSRINQHVRESDYLLVILWDQWGQPPGGESDYTSGTEEEYRVALSCLKDPQMPMRDIVVLFKGVNERQLADPGEGLKKVLEFKSHLEESRVLLYSTFDSLDEFKDSFRRHLHSWIRDWQRDELPAKKGPRGEDSRSRTESTPGTVQTEVQNGTTLAAQAKAAADRGRYTVAEQLFARATTGVYDREAFTEYVRFLRKSGRLSLAQTTAHTFLDLARDADDLVGETEALANLAILERQQGHNASSLSYLATALKVADEQIERVGETPSSMRSEALSTKAFLLDNKSLTLRRIPSRSGEALEALDEARLVQAAVGDLRGAGFTLRNQGSLLLRLGRLQEAEEALKESLRIFEEVEYPSGQATALGGLAELYEAVGDFDRAIETLEQSIAVLLQRSPSRIATNYSILARVHIKRGDFDQARSFSEYCMRAAQELGTPESLATALHSQAQLAIAEGTSDVASQALHEALELFTQVENRVGIAAVLMDLARLQMRSGLMGEARENLTKAEGLVVDSPHYGLQRELQRLLTRSQTPNPSTSLL